MNSDRNPGENRSYEEDEPHTYGFGSQNGRNTGLETTAANAKMFGILSLVIGILFCRTAGIVLGILAIVKAKEARRGGLEGGDASMGLALGIVGLVCSIIFLVFLALIILAAIGFSAIIVQGVSEVISSADLEDLPEVFRWALPNAKYILPKLF